MFSANTPMQYKIIAPVTKTWGPSSIKGDYYIPLMFVRESWQNIVRSFKSVIVFLSITAKSLSINTKYVNAISINA